MSMNTIDRFLAIRSLACLVVFYSHIPFYSHLKGFWSQVVVFNGRGAVTVFFILSGYLITKQFLSNKYAISPQGVVAFWRSRIARIIPTTYLAIVFCILIHLTHS